MTKKPKREDVKSVFAGLRPLAAQQGVIHLKPKKYLVTIR